MSEPVRFYFNEHVDPAVADGLRRLGIDAQIAAEVGHLNYPDPDHLAHATAEGRVMVTYDKDYFDLHNAGTPHAGIAYGRPWYSIGYMVGALELIHGVFTPDDMRDRLEYL